MSSTRQQRLAAWERVHRRTYPDWERRRAAIGAALARGESRRQIMRAYGVTYHLVRSLDQQRQGWQPPAREREREREQEPTWAEVNRRLAGAVRRLEEGA